MSAFSFENIIKILKTILTILEFALSSFSGKKLDEDDDVLFTNDKKNEGRNPSHFVD